MSYTPQTWNDNDVATPVNATRLTHVESGIVDVDTRLAIVEAGSGGTRAPATYTILTNGSTITVYTSTGTTQSSGADLGALITALAADYVSFAFGPGVFPWTTALTLDGKIGITMRGQGGKQNESKGSVGGRSTTQFLWTPASGQAFSAVGTQGLTLEGIGFQWSSASYTVGDGTKDGIAFMSISGVDHSTPTRHALIKNCYLGAVSSGKLDTGGPILDVNKTVNIAVRDCLFVGGTMHVRSHHTNTTDDFANVVEFTACRFSRHKAPTSSASGWPSFYGSGISWAFRNCHWEPSQGNTQYLHETQIEAFAGLSYEDCWIGDQGATSASASALVTFHGTGLRIVGGHWDLDGGYSLLKTNAITTGVVISGLDVSNITSVSGFINCPTNSVLDINIDALSTYPTTVPLINGNVAQPPRTGQVPIKSVIASAAMAQSDHGRTYAVDASAGAVTMTLPAVGCVGCTFTVKKTDSSANAVTVTRASTALIDGATTKVLAAQYESVRLISNGTNWMVIGGATTGTSTYTAITNGTTITVYNATGGLVSSGTDLGAIFNALVASRQEWRFGPGDFPITTTLSITGDTKIGISLVGSGGLSNMNIQNDALTDAVTHFRYTPNSGTVLEVLQSQGVYIRDIHFDAISATYTGTVLDFHGDYTTNPRKVTRHTGLERCTIEARKGDTTAPLLNLSTVVDFTATNCLFQGGRSSVKGGTDATAFAASEPSDEVSFYNCRFQYQQNGGGYPLISNIVKNWDFEGCVFERGAGPSTAIVLKQDAGVIGGTVSFNNCFLGDYSDIDGFDNALFVYNGTAFSIQNCWIDLPVGQSLLKTTAATSGVSLSGIYLSNEPSTPVLITVGGGNLNDVVIQANAVMPSGTTFISGNVPQPPQINRTPYKTLSADTTLTHQDHNMTFGVSASGAARVITLPAVTCVGMKVAVKKTDSSGNSVTVSRAGSALIDGATTKVLAAQYDAVRLVSDGTNWMIV